MTTPIAVNLRISPLSGESVLSGGFYQLEEDSLHVQVGSFKSGRRFFSSLESDDVRLECDHKGRLIFIEVTIPRRRWQEEKNFAPPETEEIADIRFLDFRTALPEPQIYCDKSRKRVCLRFSDKTSRSVRIGEHLVFDISKNHTLAAIWISDIIDDMAGRKIAAFRQKMTGQEKNQNTDSALKRS